MSCASTSKISATCVKTRVGTSTACRACEACHLSAPVLHACAIGQHWLIRLQAAASSVSAFRCTRCPQSSANPVDLDEGIIRRVGEN